MKKLTFLLLAALSGLTASAQTEKGKHWIGGSFSIEHSKTDYTASPDHLNIGNNHKQNSFHIGPSYSYFVADKLSLNATAGYSHSHRDQSSINNPILQPLNHHTETITNGYFASVGFDKFFLYENKVGIKTGPSVYYYSSKSKTSSSDDNAGNFSNDKTLLAGISLDFVYFPVRKLGLIASLGRLDYMQHKSKSLYNTTKTSNVGLSFLDNNQRFSFVYVLGK